MLALAPAIKAQYDLFAVQFLLSSIKTPQLRYDLVMVSSNGDGTCINPVKQSYPVELSFLNMAQHTRGSRTIVPLRCIVSRGLSNLYNLSTSLYIPIGLLKIRLLFFESIFKVVHSV